MPSPQLRALQVLVDSTLNHRESSSLTYTMASKRKISEMEEADMDAVLELAMRAARSAGAIISGVWDQKSDVKDTKSNSRDLVTETDQK